MSLLLIPLDEAIVFPSITATLTVDTGEEDRVFLLPRQSGEFGRIGVVAEPDGSGELRVEVQEIHDGHPQDEQTNELMQEYRAVVEEILELRGADERVGMFLRSIEEPGALADTTGYSPDLSREQKIELIETVDVRARLELAVEMQRERLAELQVRRRIRDDVE